VAVSGVRRRGTADGAASARTRQGLVEAAVAALREVGFSGASAREIGRRAGCPQSQVFYHFGSVVNLLLAALDEVSTRRMGAYRSMVAGSSSLTELLDAAQTVLTSDLAAGDVRVLAEMISNAPMVPGLAGEVERRLVPWFELAEDAVRTAAARVPFGGLAPTADAARVVVAGLLGLELLESLSGERRHAEQLFGRARTFAALLDGLNPPTGRETTS
jgi:AcrR family transcriptional regulator